jgi:PAS domain-containing protein
MGHLPSFSAPFGERSRAGRRNPRLVSRGLVVEAAPQQRARQALRAAERMSRTVVEGLEEGVIVIDAGQRPVSWNASALRILGLDREAMENGRFTTGGTGTLRYDNGKPITDDDNPTRRAERLGGPVRSTLLRTLSDGAERWITVLARPGEAVVMGEVGELLLRPAALGHVLARAQDRGDGARRVAHERAAPGDLALLAGLQSAGRSRRACRDRCRPAAAARRRCGARRGRRAGRRARTSHGRPALPR